MSFSKRVSFREYIQQELSSYQLPLNLKNYLIELLSFYIRSEQLFEKKTGTSKYHEKSLLELYQKSQKIQSFREKIYLYKTMGDFCLYLSGFFRESIKKKIVALSYYEDLGQQAYYVVSQSHKKQPNVFKDLSKEFKILSKALFSFQKQSASHSQSRYLLNFMRTEDLLKIH